MEELKVGDMIKERYQLIQFLGNGSFGEVWLARDKLSGRNIALKIYLTLDPAGIEEFHREYANTIDLSSPYLLTPEYFDVHGRRPFLVMKYCENGSSSKLAGNMTEERLWQFILDVANGLAVLHNQSDPIIHQDIKPDNILIDGNGRFLITDFGISKRLRATMRRQSKRDVSSGAMPYMAPERFNSNPKLNPASDVWSLGASIYELATGELPFSGFGGAMQKNGAEMPSLPSTYSDRLNKFMQSCLMMDETARPPISQLIESIKRNNKSTASKNDITSFQISKTADPVKLNISGNVTQTLIKPYFDDNFGVVWFMVCVVLPTYVLDIHHTDAFSGLSLRSKVHVVIAEFSCLMPVVMWICGYIKVKRWNSIGKYLMSGALYQMALLITLGTFLYCIFSVKDLKILWDFPDAYSGWSLFVITLDKLIQAGIYVLCVCYLFYAVRFIKKGDKLNPVVWKYSGTRTLPVLYEIVFPCIYVLFWLILFALNMGRG